MAIRLAFQEYVELKMMSPKPFESDRERVEYLFQLYEQLTAPLTAQADKPKRTRKKKTDEAE